MSLFQAWSFFLSFFLAHAACHEGIDFFLVDIVEFHIAVSDEMVAFYACRFRCLAVETLLPCEHGFADVYTPVVHESYLHDVVSAGF